MMGERHRPVDGDQFAHRDPPVQCQPRAVHHDREHQQSGQQHLDGRDDRPHPGAVHGGLAHLLGGGPVAAEEQLLAADAAQHAQPGHGVGGQLGGPARLLALHVGPAGGAGEQGQRGEREDRDAQRDDHAEVRLVEHEPDADDDQADGRRGEPGGGLHEPADLLDVAGRHGHDLARRDPPGQQRAEFGGLAGEQLLDPGGGRDPVGHGDPVGHRVAGRDRAAEQGEQPHAQRQPAAVAVHDRLDGEADADRQPGDAQLEQQAPEQALHLPAELLTAEPEEEPAARPDVRDPWVGIR
ncbi:hypothetical protein GCM10019017_68560 [Streptomyces showdoensis]